MIIYMQDTINYLISLKKLPKSIEGEKTEVKELENNKYFKITNG